MHEVASKEGDPLTALLLTSTKMRASSKENISNRKTRGVLNSSAVVFKGPFSMDMQETSRYSSRLGNIV